MGPKGTVRSNQSTRKGLIEWALFLRRTHRAALLALSFGWLGALSRSAVLRNQRRQTARERAAPTSSSFPFVIDERMNKLRKEDKRIAELIAFLLISSREASKGNE